MSTFFKKIHTRGSSLVELLVYIGLLTVLLVTVISALGAFVRSYRTLKISKSIESTAIVAMERMTRDIRNATSTDNASMFGTDPGRLVLNTILGSTTAQVEYSIVNGALRVSENGVDTGPLHGTTTQITSFSLTKVTSIHSSAVRVTMTVRGVLGTQSASRNFTGAAVMRGSY